MLQYLFHILVFALAVLLTARIVPGIKVRSFGSAIVFAIVLGLLDTLLYGILVAISFPLVFLSLGLFLLVINGFLWWLADKLVSGVKIEGFGWTILAAAVTTLLNWLFLWVIR
ncbi:MAG: phage holin family protein [Polyangia bacterium]